VRALSALPCADTRDNMYLALVMVIETVYRGHTEPTRYDWAKAQLAKVMAGLRH
jgi:hypothetical protein